jgi:hypothetical protein
MQWFLDHRKDLARFIAFVSGSEKSEAALSSGQVPSDYDGEDKHAHYLLAIPSKKKLIRALKYVLDEKEFLSPFGLRSLSRVHMDHPFMLHVDGETLTCITLRVNRNSGLFGGNSNWRGPIWFPINYLIIEALERYHHYYGEELKVECPTGSGNMLTLKEVAQEIAGRLAALFIPNAKVIGRFTAASTATHPIRSSATWCCSTSTSTATPVGGLAPAIKPVGPRWRRDSWRSEPEPVAAAPEQKLPATPSATSACLCARVRLHRACLTLPANPNSRHAFRWIKLSGHTLSAG